MWTISKQSEGWGTELIRKIKTSLTVKLFLLTTILLLFVCLLSVFSMARYIPQTYSNRLSKELQKQANDFVPVLERANSLEECYMLASQFAVQTKATVYIEDENGTILYSSDELQTTTDQDSIATIQESTDTIIVTTDNDELLSEIGYPFTLFGSEYTLCVQGDTVSINQATEAIWQTIPLVILGIFLISIVCSGIYSRYIIKLKESNIELKVEISKQRELEQKQREFFSAASHELKTPLTILKGHLTGMLNKVKGYENREVYMERSLAVVEKMETLVKELLYLSKTDESQKSEYKMIDLAELLRVQIADVTELLSEKELSLTVDIPDKLLCEVDSAQMERALQNILINAIRYSPNGEEINISLSNEKNTNIVFCKIENTGVTIPEEEISHLFEAFYRVDASRNRNTGGTGLGLYIVRKIMDLHHAKYGIKNSDRGVLFWFKMPQRRSDSDSI